MHILTVAQLTQDFLAAALIGFLLAFLPFAWWVWVFVTVTSRGEYEPKRRARE